MDKVEIPVIERTRKYGYIYWTRHQDKDVKEFFKSAGDQINIVFDGAKLGLKNLDIKNKRIPVGTRWTSKLELDTKLVLTKEKGFIDITCQ